MGPWPTVVVRATIVDGDWKKDQVERQKLSGGKGINFTNNLIAANF